MKCKICGAKIRSDYIHCYKCAVVYGKKQCRPAGKRRKKQIASWAQRHKHRCGCGAIISHNALRCRSCARSWQAQEKGATAGLPPSHSADGHEERIALYTERADRREPLFGRDRQGR